jgi:hypothetical protein
LSEPALLLAHLYGIELDQCWLPHESIKGVDHTPSVDINTKILHSIHEGRSAEQQKQQ